MLITRPDNSEICFEGYICVIFGVTIIVKTEPIEKITNKYKQNTKPDGIGINLYKHVNKTYTIRHTI